MGGGVGGGVGVGVGMGSAGAAALPTKNMHGSGTAPKNPTTHPLEPNVIGAEHGLHDLSDLDSVHLPVAVFVELRQHALQALRGDGPERREALGLGGKSTGGRVVRWVGMGRGRAGAGGHQARSRSRFETTYPAVALLFTTFFPPDS